jgi:hypothetical protein
MLCECEAENLVRCTVQYRDDLRPVPIRLLFWILVPVAGTNGHRTVPEVNNIYFAIVTAKESTSFKVVPGEIKSLSLKSFFFGSAILLPVPVFEASFFLVRLCFIFPPTF